MDIRRSWTDWFHGKNNWSPYSRASMRRWRLSHIGEASTALPSLQCWYCYWRWSIILIASVLLILEKYINNLSGTDGHRVLCRQFYTSSLPRQANCIRSFNSSLLKMKKLLIVLLLVYNIIGQGQESRHMPYPLQHGRRC